MRSGSIPDANQKQSFGGSADEKLTTFVELELAVRAAYCVD
jgi:hypothetical protein